MQNKQPGDQGRLNELLLDAALADAVCNAIAASNRQLLKALASTARLRRSVFPLPDSLRASFEAVSEEDLFRVAECPVLLADAAFSDVQHWRDLSLSTQQSQSAGSVGEWISSEDAIVLAHSVFTVAWYVVSTTPEMAGVLIGMAESVVSEYRSLGVPQLALLATRHSDWIRPRWSNRPEVWRDLLALCVSPETDVSSAMALRSLSAAAATSPRLLAAMEARPSR